MKKNNVMQTVSVAVLCATCAIFEAKGMFDPKNTVDVSCTLADSDGADVQFSVQLNLLPSVAPIMPARTVLAFALASAALQYLTNEVLTVGPEDIGDWIRADHDLPLPQDWLDLLTLNAIKVDLPLEGHPGDVRMLVEDCLQAYHGTNLMVVDTIVLAPTLASLLIRNQV